MHISCDKGDQPAGQTLVLRNPEMVPALADLTYDVMRVAVPYLPCGWIDLENLGKAIIQALISHL